MKFLSIGHLTYDYYIMLDNFLTEGSKNVVKETINCCGGSANNTAFALSKWNCESYISGVIGYDPTGNAMRKNMEENKVLTSFLETNYDIKTPVSYIFYNKQNKTRTIVTEELANVNLKKFEYDVPIDCVIADGSEYGGAVYAFNKYQNACTILNAKSIRQGLLDLFKYAKYVICSKEVAEAVSRLTIDFNNPVTMSNVYKKIVEKYPNIKLLIHLEDKGTIYSLNNEIKVLADIKTEIVDKTGANDIFTACFALNIQNGRDIETSIRLATIASSLSLRKIGSTLSVPTLNEIISYYEGKFGKLNNTNNSETPNAPQVSEAPNTSEVLNDSTTK